MQKRIAEEALFYETMLRKEIDEDRKGHDKKPLKGKDDNPPPSSGGREPESPTKKCSTTDLESGWFQKGEHMHVFVYVAETACDKNGWTLGYTISPGNLHDSRTFKGLYDKIRSIGIRTLCS